MSEVSACQLLVSPSGHKSMNAATRLQVLSTVKGQVLRQKVTPMKTAHRTQWNYFDLIFNCCEQHKQNPIHLHGTGVEAEISKTDTLKFLRVQLIDVEINLHG